MSALKKTKPIPQAPIKVAASVETVRAIVDSQRIEPVISPAHKLQQVLHNAGYRSEAFRERPMSNAMLVLTLVCVYALSMLMMLGTLTA